MKIFEIISERIIPFELLLVEASDNKKVKSNLKIPLNSKNSLHVWTGEHYDQRSRERLTTPQSQRDFNDMMVKFAKDPIAHEVEAMEIDSKNSSRFCLYNDRNLGVALVKKTISLPKNPKILEECYLITTLKHDLFPYSNQVLYKVPDNGPCRRFNKEDMAKLKGPQLKAFKKGGRGI